MPALYRWTAAFLAGSLKGMGASPRSGHGQAYDQERHDHGLPGTHGRTGWRHGPEVVLIHPVRADLGCVVFHRQHLRVGAEVTGKWVAGKLKAINRMSVLVAFKDETKELNRADLEWTVP